MGRITCALVAIGALAAGSASGAGAAPTLLHISSHLPKSAKASLDAGKAVTAPGYGSTVVAVTAGSHVLKVITSTGAIYQTTLNLKPAALMKWKGKGYWCVNLLEQSVEVYSTEDCEEDVTDAG